MKLEGIEPGRAVEVPVDALTPNVKPSRVGGDWDYIWDYQRLLTTKDIAINFPTKASPSATANRVLQTVERHLFVARLAPVFLVVFVGGLLVSGVWARRQTLRLEELALLSLAFLLFYPLFLFGAGYVGRDPALLGAVLAVTALSAAYAARLRGAGYAARVAVLDLVLLGAFTYALFDRAYTGLIFTAGALALLAGVMVLHGRRAAEHRGSDPAEVAVRPGTVNRGQ
jgi:hypothetical protein